MKLLRLGTRGSMLARMQSQQVADALMLARPDVAVQLHIVRTTGDRMVDRPLHEAGGKGLFTKELELALIAGEIDFAVHSYKDVPVTMPLVVGDELIIAVVPAREDARDVLVAGGRSLDDLPQAARVGTGSLRRKLQILNHRADLQIEPLRGNVDTRLNKQRSGELDGVVLAAAGLRRAGLFDERIMELLSVETFVPAAGQGALALQCRENAAAVIALLSTLNDPHTKVCVDTEREVVRLLDADCHSPLGVHASIEPGDEPTMVLRMSGGKDENSPADRTVVRGRLSESDMLPGLLIKSR